MIVQYSNWHTRAGIEWTGRKSYWLEVGGGGRQQSWRIVSDRTQRASCNFTHTWRWWHRFWFLDGFNSIYPLEKTTQWVEVVLCQHLTAAFRLVSGHFGLEIEILYHCTLYSTVSKVHKSTTTWRCTHMTVCVHETHELTYMIGHANLCWLLWKFTDWRFVCKGLTLCVCVCVCIWSLDFKL